MPQGVVPFPFGDCRVCADKATGVHYGVPTCEGCKGFFKRSIPKADKYRCFFGGKCILSPHNRNRCKCCRFQRCLDAGMSVEAVKMGRIPKVDKERAIQEAILKDQFSPHHGSDKFKDFSLNGDFPHPMFPGLKMCNEDILWADNNKPSIEHHRYNDVNSTLHAIEPHNISSSKYQNLPEIHYEDFQPFKSFPVMHFNNADSDQRLAISDYKPLAIGEKQQRSGIIPPFDSESIIHRQKQLQYVNSQPYNTSVHNKDYPSKIALNNGEKTPETSLTVRREVSQDDTDLGYEGGKWFDKHSLRLDPHMDVGRSLPRTVSLPDNLGQYDSAEQSLCESSESNHAASLGSRLANLDHDQSTSDSGGSSHQESREKFSPDVIKQLITRVILSDLDPEVQCTLENQFFSSSHQLLDQSSPHHMNKIIIPEGGPELIDGSMNSGVLNNRKRPHVADEDQESQDPALKPQIYWDSDEPMDTSIDLVDYNTDHPQEFIREYKHKLFSSRRRMDAQCTDSSLQFNGINDFQISNFTDVQSPRNHICTGSNDRSSNDSDYISMQEDANYDENQDKKDCNIRVEDSMVSEPFLLKKDPDSIDPSDIDVDQTLKKFQYLYDVLLQPIRETEKLMKLDLAGKLPTHPLNMLVTVSRSQVTFFWNQLISTIFQNNDMIMGICNAVPLFKHVDQEDQKLLIENAYFSMWLIIHASLFYKGNTYMRLPCNARYCRWWMGHFLPLSLIKKMYDITTELNSYDLTGPETILLCCLKLVNPDVAGLKDVDRVRELHDRYLDILAYVVERQHPKTHSRILIRIFCLRQALRAINNQQRETIGNFKIDSPPEGCFKFTTDDDDDFHDDCSWKKHMDLSSYL